MFTWLFGPLDSLAANTPPAAPVGGFRSAALEIGSGGPVAGVNAGTSTETDAALALTPLQIRSTGLATETDASIGIPLTVSTARETDTAIARPLTVSTATETDTAISLSGGQSNQAGIGQETDAPFALLAVQRMSVGIAAETDASQALAGATTAGGFFSVALEIGLGAKPTLSAQVGVSAEVDTSLRLATAVSTARETDNAFALSPGAATSVGFANELSTAIARTGVLIRPADFAVELDQALSPLAQQAGIAIPSRTDNRPGSGPFSKGRFYVKRAEAYAQLIFQTGVIGIATEGDIAISPIGLQIRPVGLVVEADTAFPLTPASPSQVKSAVESDAAIARPAIQSLLAGVASETDITFPLGAKTFRIVGTALESDASLALQLAIPQVGTASETDTAFALQPTALPAGTAIEVDLAFSLDAVQPYTAGRSDETDAALALFGTSPVSIALGRADESDLALALAGIVFTVAGRRSHREPQTQLMRVNGSAMRRPGS